MSKPSVKNGLVLLPQSIGKAWEIARVIEVEKSPKGITITHLVTTQQVLRQRFTRVPDDARQALKMLSQEYAGQKAQSAASITDARQLNDAKVGHAYQALVALKPFAHLIPFYIQTEKADKKVAIQPAAYSRFKPALSFTLHKDDTGFAIETIVEVQDLMLPMSEYRRFHFFLFSKNEWFLLSMADCRILTWLESEAFHFPDEASVKDAIAKLEEHYPVERNNIFTKKTIAVAPTARVMLSELNNAFLMLRPQWVYDGIVVEDVFQPQHHTTIAGEELIIERSQSAEQELATMLMNLHPMFSNQRNGYFYLSFAEAQKKQWFLKAYHHLLQEGVELVGMDMLQHFRYSPHSVATTYKVVAEEGNMLLMNMQVSFGTEKIKLSELQRMLLAGQKAVLLRDGSLGILPDEWQRQYGTLISHGKPQADGSLLVPRSLAVSLEQQGERSILSEAVKKQWWDNWHKWQSGKEQIYEVPATLQASLRPYQQRGFEWLTMLSEIGMGACLADDMGLGKTLQTIAFLAHYHAAHAGAVHLVVAPASLLYNWQQELHKFAPVLAVVVHHGAARSADTVLTSGNDVIITSYGTLRSDASQLLAHHYGVAILDESHNIKNPSAQITGVVHQLAANARIALSGTPVVNNTFDLYSQLSFSLPGMFGSREFFKREYADPIDRFQDEAKIKTLRKLTAPFILRRTKEQVAPDLPEKTESILWCTMSSEQQMLYNSIVEQVRGNIFTGIETNGLAKSKLAVIQGIMKLRQVCNSPLLLPEEERDHCTRSVKMQVLMDELSNLLGKHKVLVFSQFTSLLDLLERECQQHKIGYYRLDGSTPVTKRAELVTAFQEEGSDKHLFMLSLKAGNAGLTLTAADYVFLFDPYWNRATEQQAIDRTHRIGQTKRVFAYKMICKNTIEDKIIQLQERKHRIGNELVGDDDNFIQSLSVEDLQFLFS